jgi:hypothetical protein
MSFRRDRMLYRERAEISCARQSRCRKHRAIGCGPCDRVDKNPNLFPKMRYELEQASPTTALPLVQQ